MDGLTGQFLFGSFWFATFWFRDGYNASLLVGWHLVVVTASDFQKGTIPQTLSSALIPGNGSNVSILGPT